MQVAGFVDANLITAYRTAATSAVAIDQLAATGPQVLGLLHHVAALGPHRLEHRLRFPAGVLDDGGHLSFGRTADLGGGGLRFPRALAQHRLGLAPYLVGLVVGLAQELGHALLGPGLHVGRRLVGRLEQAGRLLAQRSGQRGLVELGVGGPILRLGQLPAQLPLPLGGPAQLVGHAPQVGAHLGGVEAPEGQGERAPCHLVGAERSR